MRAEVMGMPSLSRAVALVVLLAAAIAARAEEAVAAVFNVREGTLGAEDRLMSGGDLFFGRSSQGISAQQSSRDVGNRTATAHAHVPRGVLQSRPVPAPRFGNRTGPAKSSRHGPCGLLLDPWREGAERNADGDSLTCRYMSGAARTRA